MATDTSEIPAVCFLDDVCRILRVARTTVEKLRRHGAFPIPELPALDKRPRWSGQAVRRYLDSHSESRAARRPWRKAI